VDSVVERVETKTLGGWACRNQNGWWLSLSVRWLSLSKPKGGWPPGFPENHPPSLVRESY